jgi:hypothetical protein
MPILSGFEKVGGLADKNACHCTTYFFYYNHTILHIVSKVTGGWPSTVSVFGYRIPLTEGEIEVTLDDGEQRVTGIVKFRDEEDLSQYGKNLVLLTESPESRDRWFEMARRNVLKKEKVVVDAEDLVHDVQKVPEDIEWDWGRIYTTAGIACLSLASLGFLVLRAKFRR